MKNTGLLHPMAAARAAVMLETELGDLKFSVQISNDMVALDDVKQRVRNMPVAPMHHHAVGVFNRERAFWMSLTDAAGDVVGLQAFRFDEIDTHLADWCMNYMIGVYMRQNELMVPAFARPPEGSIAHRLTGRLVYHGELWMAKQVKSRRAFEVFTRLGLILSVIKWRPAAIWGLASPQMAGHGHLTRVGYSILERGFLRWQWASEGIDAVEYLVAAELASLESMIEEMTVTTTGCQREQLQIRYEPSSAVDASPAK